LQKRYVPVKVRSRRNADLRFGLREGPLTTGAESESDLYPIRQLLVFCDRPLWFDSLESADRSWTRMV